MPNLSVTVAGAGRTLGLHVPPGKSIAYGLTDSPVMQLTWIVEKVREWTDPARELPEDAVDIDHLLTLVSVYWFGGGGAGSAKGGKSKEEGET